MKKSTLIERIAQRNGRPVTETKLAIDALISELTEAVVTGEKVVLPGFGTFHRVWSPPRSGRNPKTGRLVQLHPRYHARFSPGTTLQTRLKSLIPIYDEDPDHIKARRSARTLVGDLKLYHAAALERVRKAGALDDEMTELLQSAIDRYHAKVPAHITRARHYFREELTAVLKFEVDVEALRGQSMESVPSPAGSGPSASDPSAG